ncbi:MAG: GlsB/YeaQ/YmgE family stress response membrane protein [Prevotella sp.]|nr:GlsB/YeaQ/YmgE family stress response membrane protein [Prevotella sp.]MDE6151548.1 GlsB/YeaQ/YmgE family stress response membrane protein [Prevotella sp.]
MFTGFISGAIAGYIAARITKGEGKGCLTNLVIGIIGGMVADWLFGYLGMSWHLSCPWIASVVGAILFLVVLNKLTD